jgi:DNA-binding PadR family transcriptional regulator
MSKKNKVVLKDTDVGEKGCLLLKTLYYDYSVHGYIGTNTRLLHEKSGVQPSSIRRIMSRLALFGLIHEEGESLKPKTYSISRDGIEFVKRLLEKEKKNSPTEPTQEAAFAKPDHKPEPASLVEWLREKADELKAMADHLSHYE